MYTGRCILSHWLMKVDALETFGYHIVFFVVGLSLPYFALYNAHARLNWWVSENSLTTLWTNIRECYPESIGWFPGAFVGKLSILEGLGLYLKTPYVL